MKLKNHQRLFVVVLFMVMAIAVVVTRSAEADPHPHDEGGGGDVDIDITGGDFIGGDLTGGDLIGGDTNISTGGGRALAISNSLGDVDFTGICQGSSQWNTPVFGKQKIERDETCIGFAWLKLGAYDLAQMHFCMDRETLAQYATVTACEDEHDFSAAVPDHDVHSRSDEFEAAHAQQEHEIEFLQEEQATLVGRLDDLTALLEQAPAQAQAPATVYIQQEPEPKYTDEDMAYILGLYAAEENEDE